MNLPKLTPPTIAALLLLAVLGPLAVLHEPLDPSVAEVRDVVESFLGDDETTQKNEQTLEAWGDNALPAFRQLAERGTGNRHGIALLACINMHSSQASTDLLVELLRGDSAVDSDLALDALWIIAHDAQGRSFLRQNEDFRALVFAHVDTDPTDSASRLFANIAKYMQWTDAIPRLESMLKDEDQYLRLQAAEALTSLTGTHIQAARAPATFPARAIVPGLVGPAISLGNRFRGRADFTKDENGEPRLFGSEGKSLQSIGPTGKVLKSYPLGHHSLGSLAFASAEGEPMFLTLSSKNPWGDGDYLSAVDASGALIWDFKPKRSGITDATLLYSDNAAEAVVLSVNAN